MPLGLSVVVVGALALGKSTCAADSIVTAVVTMKMISRTRKISVNGVMLMSANTPPPLFLVIFPMRKNLYGPRSTSPGGGVVFQLRTGDALGRDCDLFGARLFGDTKDSHHVAEQYFAITLEHDNLLIHLGQRVAQG